MGTTATHAVTAVATTATAVGAAVGAAAEADGTAAAYHQSAAEPASGTDTPPGSAEPRIGYHERVAVGAA